MRVLFWVESFLPIIGGVEIFSQQLMEALAARGHGFTVVTSGREASEESFAPGIDVRRFRFRAALFGGDLKQIPILRKRIIELKQSLQPDLIHLNSTLPSAFFHLQTAEVVPLPVLLTLHMPLAAAEGATTLVGRVLQSADHTVGVSQAVLDQALAVVPDIAPRSSVIHNGLEMPELLPSELTFDPPLVLGFGRLATQKGFDIALEAFVTVLQRFPQARLMLAGDGEKRSNLEQQAAQLDIAHAVQFLGWVPPDQIPDLVNCASLTIVPSRFEPFGLVALQAMQMGRPVVASSVGGLPEIVVDQETGLLVPKEDAAALAQAITFLIECPQTAVQMGSAARQRARHVFGFQHFVDAYEQLYQRLGNRSNGPQP